MPTNIKPMLATLGGKPFDRTGCHAFGQARASDPTRKLPARRGKRRNTLMHPPLEEWDSSYLQQIAQPGEKSDLEKKSSQSFDLTTDSAKKKTRAELAKQVCAFANSGGGFLVYGIADAGGLDRGVDSSIGRQGVKAWVEAEIPKLLQPPVVTCEAKFIQIPNVHSGDRGALVIAINLSERRPHWIPGSPPESAYIRAGEHSAPMRLQTFLDIASHSSTPIGHVESLVVKGPDTVGPTRYILNPLVQVERGPLCKSWSLELSVPSGRGYFHLGDEESNQRITENSLAVLFSGTEPLFPGKLTRACTRDAGVLFFATANPLASDEGQITSILSLESSQPKVQLFKFPDLKEHTS
jgi:hypothetical protein